MFQLIEEIEIPPQLGIVYPSCFSNKVKFKLSSNISLISEHIPWLVTSSSVLGATAAATALQQYRVYRDTKLREVNQGISVKWQVTSVFHQTENSPHSHSKPTHERVRAQVTSGRLKNLLRVVLIGPRS